MKRHTTPSRRHTRSVIAAALGALALSAAPAFAAHDLPPGDTGSPLNDLPADFALGTLLNSSVSTLTAPGDAWTGTFTSAVYAHTVTAADVTASSAFQLGTQVLDFVYQFSNSAASSTSIGRLSMFDFAPGAADQFAVLAWDDARDLDGAGGLFSVGMQNGDNANRGANGSTISVNYGDLMSANKIDPGETSYTILLRVNAQTYEAGFFSALNGTPGDVPSFQPLSPIPEPQTYALMLAGLAAVGFVARRHRKQD